MNTAIKDAVSESDRKPDLSGSSDRRLERGVAGLDVARDVLDHHDRIVDDKAGGDRQCHQGQIVEAEVSEIHPGERADQG